MGFKKFTSKISFTRTSDVATFCLSQTIFVTEERTSGL